MIESGSRNHLFYDTRILGRYAALILGPAGGWLTLLLCVSPQPNLFIISPYTNSIIISRLHFVFVVFVAKMSQSLEAQDQLMFVGMMAAIGVL